jgi:hypothetical protein
VVHLSVFDRPKNESRKAIGFPGWGAFRTGGGTVSNSAADGRRRRKEISPQRGQGCREGHEVFNQKVKEHKGRLDLNQDKDTTMSDETASKALDDYWDHISFIAYDHFLKIGRGWVFLEQNREADGEIRIGYAVFNGNESNFDPALVRMVREYDPDREFVLQYMREDRSIRQMRLKAGPTALFPRRAWIIGMLEQNDPEADKLVERYFKKWSRGLLFS